MDQVGVNPDPTLEIGSGPKWVRSEHLTASTLKPSRPAKFLRIVQLSNPDKMVIFLANCNLAVTIRIQWFWPTGAGPFFTGSGSDRKRRIYDIILGEKIKAKINKFKAIPIFFPKTNLMPTFLLIFHAGSGEIFFGFSNEQNLPQVRSLVYCWSPWMRVAGRGRQIVLTQGRDIYILGKILWLCWLLEKKRREEKITWKRERKKIEITSETGYNALKRIFLSYELKKLYKVNHLL